MRDAHYQPPTAEQVRRYAAAKGIEPAAAERRLVQERERFLTLMRGDAYTYGYEPDIWLVAKALLRGAKPTPPEVRRVKNALDVDWETFARRMRERLGFRGPVGEMLIMGANRSGKTDFASKLAMQFADEGKRRLVAGFQTLKTGKGTQMKRLWHYMPTHFKERNIALKKASRIDEHISYTEQNGFAGSKITFGNGSALDFVTYEMDVKAIEGSEYDFGWLDEEFPMEFLGTLRSRLASKRGTLLATFTPISGYTPVVADFLDGMRVTQWHTAHMLPLDGGEPEPWSELGLTREEYGWLLESAEKGQDCGIPEARPERCVEWLGSCGVEGLRGGGDSTSQRLNTTTTPRAFAQVPRVAVCKGGQAAAVWFYGSDNPYGIPSSVIASAARNRRATAEIKARVYGIAEKLTGRLFPKFSRARNVIAPEELPKRLVRIMVVDPAPERNWCCGWYGWDPAADVLYKYREWPGNYEIPGVGVPPPWAQLSDRNRGVNDGEYAGGQEDFGMSFLKYKFEWARLERWRDYEEWANGKYGRLPPLAGARSVGAGDGTDGAGPRTPESAAGGSGGADEAPDWPEDIGIVEDWSELAGTAEPIRERVIDARAAAQSKMSMRENLTLFDEVAKLAEGFVPASGQKIAVGLDILRDRIETGRYKVTAECVNTIFAYEQYTGRDGQKGAVKDWIDLDRYAVLSGVFECDAEDAEEIGDRAAAQGRHALPGGEESDGDCDFAGWAE